MPIERVDGNALYASLAIEQINLIFFISSFVLIIRISQIASDPSTKFVLTISFNFMKSLTGILSAISLPNSKPICPKVFFRFSRFDFNKLIPSSSGLGDGQVLISSNQVLLNSDAPISGTIAIGFPDNGTITNQGRVGLSQN